MDNPIGIFDSGVGGLTVLREMRKQMPHENLVYFGDTARAPYGGKSTETLINHGREIMNFFVRKKVKAVVIACGTSSSTSFETLRAEFSGLPIIDTIRPAVSEISKLFEANKIIRTNGNIFEEKNHKTKNNSKHNTNNSESEKIFKPVFIATEATIRSGLFARLLAENSPEIELQTRACPLFAPMVEAGFSDHPFTIFAAQNYLADLRGKVNALIFGCTHYPLLAGALTRVLGEIEFIDPAVATVLHAKKIFVPTNSKSPPKIKFFTSGDPKKFSAAAKIILNEKISARKASF
ncbi:MAG: glutamate racemase [Defluviitaleaceae bacterium]|nr:glutamate racemase [Defluviitaleaceae bacterium]